MDVIIQLYSDVENGACETVLWAECLDGCLEE